MGSDVVVCSPFVPALPYIVGVQSGNTTTAEQRDLIEEVLYAVEDLVELIKTYQSKNKLTKVFLSTSLKRRQEDLEVAIDRALGRLQVRFIVAEVPCLLVIELEREFIACRASPGVCFCLSQPYRVHGGSITDAARFEMQNNCDLSLT